MKEENFQKVKIEEYLEVIVKKLKFKAMYGGITY
jgi:hypothetical protein